MFKSFRRQYVRVNGVNIHYRIGGKGPGLLLIHGHPQSHTIWHGLAEELAEHFTVVAADLRGYGDSDRIPGDPEHKNYSKRAMAADLSELMNHLDFQQYQVLAHDRGARVAHRLALDNPVAVKRLMLLDIAPTLAMYEQTDEAFARLYWHWFFLIRPAPLPETLLEADPELYLRSVMVPPGGVPPFSESAWTEYLRCFLIPGTATAMCEDYRASATIDLEHDRQDREAGNKLDMPLRVLWGKSGAVDRCFDVAALWKDASNQFSGQSIEAGHFMVEEVPKLILGEAVAFFHLDE